MFLLPICLVVSLTHRGNDKTTETDHDSAHTSNRTLDHRKHYRVWQSLTSLCLVDQCLYTVDGMKIVFVLLVCLLSGVHGEGEEEDEDEDEDEDTDGVNGDDDDDDISAYSGGTIIIRFDRKSDECDMCDTCKNVSRHCTKTPTEKFVTVSIHSLDKGVCKYKCKGKEVDLEVLPVPSSGHNQKLQRAIGGSVDITCDFPKRLHNSTKFLCRGANSSTCIHLYPSDTSNRYSVTDGNEKNYLMVTIKNLSKGDAEVYWCALSVTLTTLTYVSLYRTIQLDVTDSPSSTSSSSRTTSSPVSKVATAPSTATPNNLGSYVVLSVFLTLVVVALCGIALFIWVKYRKRRGRDLSSNHGDTVQQGNKTATAHVYEEIQDTTISASGPNTVYALAQLPTNPSSNPTYSTVQLPTSPGGDLTYSMVQLPADPSEDPGFASVTFQKNPQITTLAHNDELSCDYTTVS
ncbi:uncharacterized protein LOC143124722 [Alosa pseudoharengus]|uniref:uncharacterized protein LOC143124722 n=1 Tax=Alosa pseudoharengus TaxID=34774 RepID=UPI003F8B911E